MPAPHTGNTACSLIITVRKRDVALMCLLTPPPFHPHPLPIDPLAKTQLLQMVKLCLVYTLLEKFFCLTNFLVIPHWGWINFNKYFFKFILFEGIRLNKKYISLTTNFSASVKSKNYVWLIPLVLGEQKHMGTIYPPVHQRLF